MSPPQGAVLKEHVSILSIKQTRIWLCGFGEVDETESPSSHSHLFLVIPCSHQKSGLVVGLLLPATSGTKEGSRASARQGQEESKDKQSYINEAEECLGQEDSWFWRERDETDMAQMLGLRGERDFLCKDVSERREGWEK